MGFDVEQEYFLEKLSQRAILEMLGLTPKDFIKAKPVVPDTPEQRNLKAHGRLDNNSAKL